MTFWPGQENATCGICDKPLDDTRVFGLCRPCAEAKHASRKARKMLAKIVRDHTAVTAGKSGGE